MICMSKRSRLIRSPKPGSPFLVGKKVNLDSRLAAFLKVVGLDSDIMIRLGAQQTIAWRLFLGPENECIKYLIVSRHSS